MSDLDGNLESEATPPLPGRCEGCDAPVELLLAGRWSIWCDPGTNREHDCARGA